MIAKSVKIVIMFLVIGSLSSSANAANFAFNFVNTVQQQNNAGDSLDPITTATLNWSTDLEQYNTDGGTGTTNIVSPAGAVSYPIGPAYPNPITHANVDLTKKAVHGKFTFDATAANKDSTTVEFFISDPYKAGGHQLFVATQLDNPSSGIIQVVDISGNVFFYPGSAGVGVFNTDPGAFAPKHQLSSDSGNVVWLALPGAITLSSSQVTLLAQVGNIPEPRNVLLFTTFLGVAVMLHRKKRQGSVLVEEEIAA